MLKNQKRITEMEEMTIRFRSVFEAEFASDLQERNIEAKYENDKIRYVPKTRLYTPDFTYLVIISTSRQKGVSFHRIELNTCSYRSNILILISGLSL